jgi:hypothetical protein
MIRETVYTSIGAASLAADFVTSPRRQLDWLRKAERRGAKLADSGQRRVERSLDATYGRVLELVGLGETKATRAARTIRRDTPKVAVRSRAIGGKPARRATGRTRARRTTISVVTPNAAREERAS